MMADHIGPLSHLQARDTSFDLTPYGRQETWEDSPAGWPQTPAYDWMRLHDAYETS